MRLSYARDESWGKRDPVLSVAVRIGVSQMCQKEK